MPSLTTKILRVFLILLLPIVIITAAVSRLVTDQYLSFEYSKASFPPDSFGFTKQQRFILASTNIHYVRAHLPSDELSKHTVNDVPVYTSREVSHMADVRAVFQSLFQVLRGALVLLVSIGLILWQKKERLVLSYALQWGGLLTCGVILLIAVLASFAWQSWFSAFHFFFFEPGSWLFSYSDTLIRLFPVKFWFDATLTISLLGFVGGLLMVLIGRQCRIAVEKPPRRHAWSSMFEY